MNVHNIIFNSLSYPFTNLKRFSVYFVLQLTSFLVIPGIIAYGYEWRIVEHSMKGEKGLPDFDNLIELFGNGFNLVFVSLFYTIPPALVSFFLLNRFTWDSISINLAFMGVFTSPVDVMIFVLSYFFVSLLSIIGFANIVYEKQFIAAFDFKRIFYLISKIGLRKYLTSIALYILIMILIGYFVLMGIPKLFHENIIIFGVILAGTLKSYFFLFRSRLEGLVYPLESIN